MAQKKKTASTSRGTSNQKRSTSSKTAKQSPKEEVRERKAPAKRVVRGLFFKIYPYVLILLGIVLAICLIVVHVVGSNDGVGVIGYALPWLFGGLFGGMTLLLPVAFLYLGGTWAWYNARWKEREIASDYEGYRKAKHRLVFRQVMTWMFLLTISVMFGVAADYSSLDLLEMWQDSADELLTGGGALGGLFGFVMVAAFEQVISFVLLGFLLIIFGLLMVGITPDYILTKIRERNEIRREVRARWEEEMRAEEAKQEAEDAKQRAEEQKQAAIAAALEKRRSKEEAKRKKQMEMSVDEIMDISDEQPSEDAVEEYAEPKMQPLETEATTQEEKTDLVSEMLADADEESPIGEDFGGEGTLDTEVYDTLDNFFKDLSNNPQQQEPKPTESGEAAENGEIIESEAEPLDLSEIGSDELLSDVAEVAPEEGDGEEEPEPPAPYIFPPIDLLEKNKNKTDTDYTAELQENAHRLLDTLKSFKINIKEINYSRGPTITRYELRPEAGVRVRSIANLVDDIALSLATSGVRIEAPIPGKPAVGIEVPNRNRATVYLRDLIDNTQFQEAKSRLTACLGMDVGGNPIYFDISKMPHMIIAGATGMGKSVCINCVIMSILYKARPEDVKLILVDPKKVEFNLYKDIPHLYAPIVSEPKKAAGALASAVAEMERRFELIEEVGVRDITSYNAATENDPYKEHMPHMVIIIDELADLMMTAPDEVESSICRLAQKARAAGIHIIIGTQRPSVDVITGLIKANIPSRIACTVASQVDSRTIIDIAGAEKLIGRGDMLFAPVGAAKPLRVQGAFVTENEVESICTYIRENNSKAKYNSEFINRIEEAAAGIGNKKGGGGMDAIAAGDNDGGDSKFHEAVKLAVEEGKISTSLMQRRLGVGYGRAAKIIDTMEQMGYVSKPDGNKPRRVLLTAEEYSRRVTEGTLGDADD